MYAGPGTIKTVLPPQHPEGRVWPVFRAVRAAELPCTLAARDAHEHDGFRTRHVKKTRRLMERTYGSVARAEPARAALARNPRRSLRAAARSQRARRYAAHGAPDANSTPRSARRAA